MFVINDNDMPIVVAQKIINGTMPLKQHFFADAICETVTDSKLTQDMFNLEEIKEIADYLMVYYNSHPKGD